MKFKLDLTKSFALFVILMLAGGNLWAQSKTVRGTVTDAGGTVAGVTVIVQGTSTGTTTVADGTYEIRVPDNNAVLEFNFLGYEPVVIPVGDRTTIDVVLQEDSQLIDDVVVIGYQTIRRRDLTGSVASVTGAAISAAPVANAAQALQGKLPGVNVIAQDGRPDASISIRVRGGGSISQSNEPLILVDGIATSSLSDIPSSQIESIDVLKDASSTAIYGSQGANGVILVTTKGAKEGTFSVSYSGYAKFNTPTKYLDVLSPYDYVSYVWANAAANGDAYRTPFEQAFGLGDYQGTGPGIEGYRNVPYYNMQKEIYNSSFSHNHDVSVTGGTDRTRVRFSFNYMDEDGMKANSYLKRGNVSLKLDQKLFKNADFAIDARYVNIQSMSGESTSSYSGSVLSSSYRFRPIATDDLLGDYRALYTGNIDAYAKSYMQDEYSMVSRNNDYEPLKTRDHVLGTASLNWKMIEGLTYHTDFTLGQTWNNNKTWSGAIYKSYINSEGEKTHAGDAEIEKTQKWTMRWSNTLNFERTLNEIHRINVLVGHEVTNSGGESLKIGATKFPSNFTKENAFAMMNQYDADANGVLSLNTGKDIPERKLSFFGRANYTLLDRYLLTFTFRADGSSKFSPNNRWGYFPAAAAAWRINEEPFMAATRHWMDNLKLRVSYGQSGSDGITSSLWAQDWESVTDQRQQQTINNTLYPAYTLGAQMANPDLKWETTITRNIGLDMGFLNGRLNATIDAYWNNTKDLLMSTSIPGITGFTSTYRNVGETSNKGIEFSVSGRIFENKDWSITASANINFNRNRVEKLADNFTGLYGTAWSSSSLYPSSDYVLMEGKAVGLVRGLVYDGFYTVDDFNYADGVYTLKDGVADLSSSVMQVVHGVGSNDRPSGQVAYPGLAKFKDLDNSGTIGDEDLTVIGNMNPKHTGGLNLNVNFKNFDLGLYFNWSYGNDVYNVNKLSAMFGYKEAGVYENKLAISANSYKIYDIQNGQLVRLTTPEQLNAANVNASQPLAYNENGITSSLGIEDGSYLRLNTLTLGYTLPERIIQKAGIKHLRIYGSIYNVFTITGYSGLDPEVNADGKANKNVLPTPGLDWGAYPRSRQFVVGLNINF